MYHQPSKRKQLLKRIVSYGFMSIAVVVLVVVLIFVMLGYQYNSNDHRVEQGGLVQFDSQPNGASVTIDGKMFGTHTPSKTTLDSGQHTFTIARSGYQTWQKTVNLTPGSVLWLNYARLVPNKLTPKNVQEFSTVSSTVVSTDDKWIAVKEQADTPDIRLVDISGDTIKASTITIPSEMYTAPVDGKNQSFKLTDWDAGSRYILVKHTYDGSKIEWLVVDTRDASATKNVTKLLDIQASKVVFSGNNSSILYAQIGTDVRKIDLGAATLSRPLVSNVAEFSIFDGSTIIYSTQLDDGTKTRSVGYYKDGDPQSYAIKTYKDDGKAPLHIAVGRYFGDMYEAIDYGDTIEILRGDLPTSGTPSPTVRTLAKVTFPGGAKYLDSKTSGRFFVAQNGTTYKTYDLELKKQTSTTLRGTGEVTKKLEWLDNYTVESDLGGTLRLYEFDGANQHDIMKVAPGYSVTLSPNDKYLYGFKKTSDTSWQLERVQMILS